MSRPPRRLSLCRDIKFMSRPQFQAGQVVMPIPCRDLMETNLCRDFDFMSRPHSCPQWDFQVTTSHTVAHVATSNSCRKIKSNQPYFCYVATPFFHVATSLVNCRDAVSAESKQTRSRLHFLVTTSRPAKPGRDIIMMSRHPIQPT